MIRKLTIAGIFVAMLACLRAARGEMPIDLAIAIAQAQLELESTPVSIPTPKPAGGATRPLPVTRTPPAAVDLDSLPAGQQPTPMEVVSQGLAALDLKPTDTFADIGCGFDCRVGITAARVYGCKVVAIEIDPVMAALAKRYVERNGVSDLVTVIVGDATKVQFKANKGAACLWEETLAALRPKIATMDNFASFFHQVPGRNSLMSERRIGDVYLYERMTRQAFVSRPSAAVWNGRQYSGPVCNRRNCSMCAAIRRQLAQQTVVYKNVPAAATVAKAQPAGRYVDVRVKRCNGRQCWYETQRVWQAY